MTERPTRTDEALPARRRGGPLRVLAGRAGSLRVLKAAAWLVGQVPLTSGMVASFSMFAIAMAIGGGGALQAFLFAAKETKVKMGLVAEFDADITDKLWLVELDEVVVSIPLRQYRLGW